MRLIQSIIIALSVCAVAATIAGDEKDSKHSELDAKNGFREIKLGTRLSRFTGLKPLEWRSSTADEKRFMLEKFDSKLGDFEISMILLNFDTDLLKEITVYATGKQNAAGLLESLKRAYGEPDPGWGKVTWNGKRVVLTFEETVDENGLATFKSKEVEAKLKFEAEKKAKEGAEKASKGF